MMKVAGELLLHLIGSIINISCDAINSLDMLNVSETVKESINNLEERIADGFKHDTNNVTNLTNIDIREDIVWGSLGMTFIFLPGFPFLLANISSGSVKDILVAAACFFCFPAALLLMQLLAAFGAGEEFVPSLLTAEAVFQCFPHLVLQVFIIIYDYPITPLLMVTIASSFLILFKNAIRHARQSVVFDD